MLLYLRLEFQHNFKTLNIFLAKLMLQLEKEQPFQDANKKLLSHKNNAHNVG